MKTETDRFDLEQNIMDCWKVIDDLQMISKYFFDGPMESFTEDNVHNKLNALHELYDIKFHNLWETFEKLVTDHKIL